MHLQCGFVSFTSYNVWPVVNEEKYEFFETHQTGLQAILRSTETEKNTLRKKK